MTKSYLTLIKSTCDSIKDSYNNTTILNYDEMAEYQEKLEKLLSTLNKCFIQSVHFEKAEYVECLDYIFDTKDYIYKSYFGRYE